MHEAIALLLSQVANIGEPVAAPSQSWLGTLLVKFLPNLADLAVVLLVALVLKPLKGWLNSMSDTNWLSNVGKRLDNFAETVVADLNATLKPQLLAATADGVITAVEGAELRAAALARLKTLLGQQGLAEVSEAFGLGLGAVDGFLQGVLERKVDQVGTAKAAVNALAGATAEAKTAVLPAFVPEPPPTRP